MFEDLMSSLHSTPTENSCMNLRFFRVIMFLQRLVHQFSFSYLWAAKSLFYCCRLPINRVIFKVVKILFHGLMQFSRDQFHPIFIWRACSSIKALEIKYCPKILFATRLANGKNFTNKILLVWKEITVTKI